MQLPQLSGPSQLLFDRVLYQRSNGNQNRNRERTIFLLFTLCTVFVSYHRRMEPGPQTALWLSLCFPVPLSLSLSLSHASKSRPHHVSHPALQAFSKSPLVKRTG